MDHVKGIVNIKGSCYINTVLQLLFHDERFVDCLETVNGGNEKLFNKLKSLYKDRSVENTRAFIAECCAQLGEYMDFRMQNDIQEFMILLLDHLNKELRILGMGGQVSKGKVSFMEYLQNEWVKHHPDGISEIADCFHGQTITQIKCPTCKEIFHNAEVFTTLALDLEVESSLENLIDNYFEGDMIEDWKCDKCKACHAQVKRTIALTRTPETLIITLKRFRSGVKNRNRVTIAPDLKLDVFKNRVRRYKLASVGCHVGCHASGHYFANLRTGEDKWIMVDDESVFTGGCNDMESSAYLLMYTAEL